MMLTALQCVVCLVDGQARQFEPGDELPDMPADEADRLVQLGAARVAEGKAAGRRRRGARAPVEGEGADPGNPADDAPGGGTPGDEAADA